VTKGNPKTTEELVFSTPAIRYALQSLYETAELLRSFYGRKAKWIPKGTVMHGSNILPQIINLKKEGI